MVLLAAFAALPAADAQEFELRAADLRVVGDARWTGGAWGGYHPIRLEVTNFGPGRDLELRFAPHDRGEGVPTVRRRVRVEQNATARLTLSVPLLGGNSGRLEIAVDGTPVEGLRRDFSLMPPDAGGLPVPSLLVISPAEVDAAGFQHAALVAAQGVNLGAAPGGHVLANPAATGDVRHAVVGPALLPSSWVDYTAVDLIAIRLDALAALRPDERAALLDWTAAGGGLIVHGVGGPPAESEEVGRLLGGTAEAAGAAEWQAADPQGRQTLPPLFSAEAGTPDEGNPLSPFPAGTPGELINRLIQTQNDGQAFDLSEPRWPAEAGAFAVRRFGFGRVASVSADAFTGGGSDWAWLLAAMHGPATPWPVRHGITAGRGDIEFINLPIPGVRGVPTVAFLSLISLFALVIGPVNYFVLWRKKQLSRLVVTVPAIAAVTSVLLFGYAAAAHGFGTKGRVRSVTLVDPASNSATSVTRMALFAGLAPSRGLTFSNRTAVYPLYPYGEEFTDGEVDWTDAQGLTAGWLKTRTRTQFVTVNRRDERGRLTVTPVAGGLKVVNGFAVPLRHLVVTARDGTPHYAGRVAAGGEATLEPLTEPEWADIRELALDRLPEPPEGIQPEEIALGFGSRPWMWFQPGWKPAFRTSLVERHLARLNGSTPTLGGGTEPPPAVPPTDPDSPIVPGAEAATPLDTLIREDVVDPLAAPRGFLAVVDGNPGIELGGLEVSERDSVHVLMGRW